MRRYCIIPAVLIATTTFGGNEILMSSTMNTAFNTTKEFSSGVDSFTVASGSGWLWLIAWASNDYDTIVKTRIKGTAVKNFNPGGGYINQFAAGITADNWAYLKAISSNGQSDTIFKSHLKGILTQAWSNNNPVSRFDAIPTIPSNTKYLTIGEFATELPIWTRVPFSLSLSPSPVRDLLNIRYSVSGIVEIHLNVYDSSGRLVRTLINEQKGEGCYTIEWDIKTDNSKRAASGTYFVVLQVQSETEAKELKKVIVVR